MKSLALDAPQLGEHAWHAFTDDRAIDNVSVDHRDRIEAFVRKHLPSLDWRRARLLEVAAYRHYTAHILAATHGCEAVVTDIAASLRDGTASAAAQGLHGKTTMVVADFHDLPFSDDYFDVVFVASSVHHTRSPEQVLRDMLRVLKPAGILIVENEPCARVCCFHAFVSNRQESFTPFEAALREAGQLASRAAMVTLFEKALDISEARLPFIRTLLSESWADDSILQEFGQAWLGRIHHGLEAFIGAQVTAGAFRPVDPAIAARMVIGMFAGLVLPMLRGVEPLPSPPERHALAETIVAVLLDGVQARPRIEGGPR